MRTAIVLVAALASLAFAAPPEADAQDRQSKHLQHRVSVLTAQKHKLQQRTRALSARLRAARQEVRALHGEVSEQVAEVGRTVSLLGVKTLVLDPLEEAWPCDKNHSLYLGSYIASVTLELGMNGFEENCPWVSSEG